MVKKKLKGKDILIEFSKIRTETIDIRLNENILPGQRNHDGETD